MATRHPNAWLDGYELEVTVEKVDVTTNMPKLDPDWTWTDEAGHVHRNVPRTYVRHQEPDWIDEDGDEHPGDSWNVCPLCDEEVRPGMRPPTGFREYIPGPKTAKLTYPDGFVIFLTQEGLDAVQGAAREWPDALPTVLARIRAEQRPLPW